MTIDLMDLKAQIERSYIKEMASHFSHEHDVYHVRILLKDNAVVTGIDFNLNLAKDKALSTAVEYGLKKGWIQEQSQIHTFTFSKALDLIKAGQRVTRQGWNGNGMWLMLIPKSHWETTRGLEMLDGLPWVGIKTVDDKFVPWLPSQTDLFADDWMIAA